MLEFSLIDTGCTITANQKAVSDSFMWLTVSYIQIQPTEE